MIKFHIQLSSNFHLNIRTLLQIRLTHMLDTACWGTIIYEILYQIKKDKQLFLESLVKIFLVFTALDAVGNNNCNFGTSSQYGVNSRMFTSNASRLQMKNTMTTIINIVAKLCSLISCAERQKDNNDKFSHWGLPGISSVVEF